MAKDMSGSLSKNKRKEKETHPDLKGKFVIDGREGWISAWTKEGDDGKWLSLAFEWKEEKSAGKPAPAQKRTAPIADDDDSLPF